MIAGTEKIFIDNLTQEGGHSRKHHDIGLTTELSIRQRRGACFYRNAPTNIVTPDYHQPLQTISTFDTNALTTPPPTPTKPIATVPPLYTTFKMVDMSKKPQQEPHDDSDNDSGVDVDMRFVDAKNFRKRRRTTTTNDDDAVQSKKNSVSGSTICPPSSMQDLQHVNTSMVYDTPTSTPISSFDISPTPTLFEINNWVENSLLYSENQLYAVTPHELQWPTTDVNSLWNDSIVVPPLPILSSPTAINASAYNNRKQSPITINLDDEEITHKYLHFEDEEEDILSHAYIPHFIPTTMPITIHNTTPVHDFLL